MAAQNSAAPRMRHRVARRGTLRWGPSSGNITSSTSHLVDAALRHCKIAIASGHHVPPHRRMGSPRSETSPFPDQRTSVFGYRRFAIIKSS
jgi:hypothetical protein